MTTTALPAFVEPLGHGVFAVDTAFHRDHFDAAYLLVHDGRAAFVDTGTNHAVPRLLQRWKRSASGATRWTTSSRPTSTSTTPAVQAC
jgi:hypothetical protein